MIVDPNEIEASKVVVKTSSLVSKMEGFKVMDPFWVVILGDIKFGAPEMVTL